MFSKLYLILVQLLICNAKSYRSKGYVNEPKCNVTVNTGLRYYVTDPNSSKYIECVAKNWGIEQFCEKGTFFNEKMVSCMVPENSTRKFEVISTIIYENITNTGVNKRLTPSIKRTNAFQMHKISRQNIKRNVPNLNSQIDNLINNLLCHLNYSTEHGCINETADLSQNATLNSTSNQSFNLSNTTFANETNLSQTEIQKRNVPNLNSTANSTQHLNLNSNSSHSINFWKKASLKFKSILKSFKLEKCLCLNGACNEFSRESECICWPSYSGNSCEIDLSNLTNNNKWSNLLNNSLFTFNEQSNYTLHWTEFIEKLWSDLNPEHLFVKNFNFSSTLNESLLQSSFQKLCIYSRQVYAKFSEHMQALENFLAKIVNLTQQNDNSLVRIEASKFINDLKNKSMKQTHPNNTLSSAEEEAIQTFEKNDFKNKILKELNTTTKLAHKLLKCFKMTNHSDFYSTLKLTKLTELISKSADKSWSDVVNYGFLYLTYELTNSSSDDYFDLTHRKLNISTRILRKHKRQVIYLFTLNSLIKKIILIIIFYF